MKVILINAAGTRTEHNFPSLEVACGDVGSKWPVVCDGRAGHFEFIADQSADVRFVETDEDFRHFRFDHLPDHLKTVSRHFYEVAEWMVLTLPPCRQRTFALQQLLVVKDAAVRARLTS